MIIVGAGVTTKPFGISCMDDVINSRILLAKEYLIHSTQSIAEVSFICGYNNVEHFCRQFKQMEGYTPGAFRNKTIDLCLTTLHQ